jgi:putative two-component system response regulator
MSYSGKETVMIVDDVESNVKLLKAILRSDDRELVSYLDGESALEEMGKVEPDIILLDISMPGMSGFEVCEKLQESSLLRTIPVLFISALSELKDKVKAFKAGGVDYITKPFQPEEVKARVSTHLALKKMQKNLQGMVEEKTKEVYESHRATIFALAKLAEHRDNDTGKHIERVQTFTRILAEEMLTMAEYSGIVNEEFVENLYHATPLHDIGKVAIPDSILLKPGKLTAEEFNIIKTHTISGSEHLSEVSQRYKKNAFLEVGVALTRSHHEKWDGSGYPDGLTGEEIPLAGRIMAVADVYDALRTRRVYKPPFSHQKTREIILADSGKQFDPGIIKAFLARESEFEQASELLQSAEES